MDVSHYEFFQPGRDRRRFDVLCQIFADSTRSQHAIAAEVGLSAAAVNRYIRDMIEQGLVQLVGNTNKTTQYHLTANGKSELSRLARAHTAGLLEISSELRVMIADALAQWRTEKLQGIVVAGAKYAGGLICVVAELVAMPVFALIDLDSERHGDRFLGYVIQSPKVLEAGSWSPCGLICLGAEARAEAELQRLAERHGYSFAAL